MGNEDDISAEIATLLELHDAVSARLRAETARRSVLVVDDDPAQLRAIDRALKATYDTRLARSATDAIRFLESGHRFDVILCDIWMPGIDGAVFHAAISLTAPEEAARTIFVTGGGLTPQLEAFLRDKRVLRKPWKRDELLRAVARMIEPAGADERCA